MIQGARGKPSTEAKAAVASSLDGYESLEVLVVSSKNSNEDQIIDSSCTFHMTPNEAWFQDLKKGDDGVVLLSDNKSCKIKGIGSVTIRMFDGCKRTLQGVRFVPELRRNLISVGMLDASGCTVKIDSGSIKVTKGALVVMKGKMQNNLYILDKFLDDQPSANVASKIADNTRLWHLRLGHISEDGIHQLSKQDLLCGDLTQKLDFCENCVLGKSHRLRFGKAMHNSNGVLDYIHSDLWEPAKIQTMEGCKYFMFIIDDFSRRVWVSCLKSKDQALETFIDWKTLIENQMGRRVKKLRRDNGLEFCSNNFHRFCADNGIARHLTVTHTLQQNGLAERMNRTLLDRVRCMMSSVGLPNKF